jgi:hypothetical protein
MNDTKSLQNTHGGPGRGQGRKPLAGEGGELTKPRTITLSESDWLFLEEIGSGNVSQGVRQVIATARENSEN